MDLGSWLPACLDLAFDGDVLCQIRRAAGPNGGDTGTKIKTRKRLCHVEKLPGADLRVKQMVVHAYEARHDGTAPQIDDLSSGWRRGCVRRSHCSYTAGL